MWWLFEWEHSMSSKCTVVSYTDCIKYLGLTLDKEVDWKNTQSLKKNVLKPLATFFKRLYRMY